MTITLETLVEKTNTALENLDAVKTVPTNHNSKDHLALLNEFELDNQVEIIKKSSTRQLLDRIGLQKVTVTQCVELLLPPGTYQHSYNLRAYRGCKTIASKDNLASGIKTSLISSRNISTGVTLQTCVGGLHGLKVRIPYGVLLRVKELLTLNIFDCFKVVAPIDMWDLKEIPKSTILNTDPIIVGSIMRDVPSVIVGGEWVSEWDHWFVAKWDLDGQADFK